MDRVLLINTPPFGVHNPPIGLAYISEFLLKNNIWHNVLDFNIELFHKAREDEKKLWHMYNKDFWNRKETFDLIKKRFEKSINKILENYNFRDYSIVAFSVIDGKENITNFVIKKIKGKNPKIKVIIGGPSAMTKDRRNRLKADFFIVGEGEEAFYELVKAIKEEKLREEISKIPGVITRIKGKETKLIAREPIDLSKIPFSTYTKFNLDKYLGENTLLYEWSRGCIGNCTYCKGKELLGGYRCKSAAKIFAEIKYNYKKHNVKKFTVCDSLMNGNLKVLNNLCDLIIKEKLKLKWSGQALTRPDMNLDLLEKLKEAGCYMIQWGVESGSDEILKKMNRLYKLKDAEKVLKLSREAGISNEVFLIIGFPGETEKEFRETLKFIKKNRKNIDDIKSVNTLHIIEGTFLHLNANKFNVWFPKEDWYYKWLENSNTINTRNKRVKKVFSLANRLKIPVKENNLMEGKEKSVNSWDQLIGAINDIPLK